jgi:dTDP-4-amino-4,6-dideoxygalactose transaminase
LSFKYGVRAVAQYNPLYRYPMFIKAGFGKADCPETDRFFDNMISFPFQHWMSDEDFRVMIDLVKRAVADLREKAVA